MNWLIFVVIMLISVVVGILSHFYNISNLFLKKRDKVIFGISPLPSTTNSPSTYTSNAPANNNISYGQLRILKIMEKIYPNERIISNYRPDFLYNPYTKRNLEIDIWLPDQKLAIEVDGSQHDKFSQYFHGTMNPKLLTGKISNAGEPSAANYANFIKQRMRDVCKDEWLKFHNIRLIRISSTMMRIMSDKKLRDHIIRMNDIQEPSLRQ